LEGLSIPVNFEVELKPLHTTIMMSEIWLENNFVLLNEMNLFKENNFQVMLAVNVQFPGFTGVSSPDNCGLSIKDHKMKYQEFASVVNTSCQLTATFETQRLSTDSN
jgi:hypothetical protein